MRPHTAATSGLCDATAVLLQRQEITSSVSSSRWVAYSCLITRLLLCTATPVNLTDSHTTLSRSLARYKAAELQCKSTATTLLSPQKLVSSSVLYRM